MPERFSRGTFEPEFVALLVDVYGGACAEADKRNGGLSDAERDKIAKAIMKAAQSGTQDPDALRQAGLSGLAG